jgi:uncharacterized protein (DUF488 family)
MLATIGYERSTLADFIATLRLARTDVLVDIRERAQSRRPGFSKSALSQALSEAGIKYLHLRELGDPAEGRAAARSGQVELFRSIFGEVMKTDAAVEALGKIENLTLSGRVCLMCFERDHKECHRKIVADALETRLGVRAAHLGVKLGAADDSRKRRVLHSDQGSAAPF